MAARMFDELLVVDVESTCWRGEPPGGQVSEIIEIGLARLDLRTLERLEKRSIMVRPGRSEVGAFCTELTTIRPEDVADAGSLSDACKTLREELRSRERPWASWGDYDRRQLERNCRDLDVPYPFGPTHLNAKALFAMSRGMVGEVGMANALRWLGLPHEGTHHRGDDDAWNIAAILAAVLRAARAGLEPAS